MPKKKYNLDVMCHELDKRNGGPPALAVRLNLLVSRPTLKDLQLSPQGKRELLRLNKWQEDCNNQEIILGG